MVPLAAGCKGAIQAVFIHRGTASSKVQFEQSLSIVVPPAAGCPGLCIGSVPSASLSCSLASSTISMLCAQAMCLSEFSLVTLISPFMNHDRLPISTVQDTCRCRYLGSAPRHNRWCSWPWGGQIFWFCLYQCAFDSL